MVMIWGIWLLERKLHLKLGTDKTFRRFRSDVEGIWPIFVTSLEVPSGKLTEMGFKGFVCCINKA